MAKRDIRDASIPFGEGGEASIRVGPPSLLHLLLERKNGKNMMIVKALPQKKGKEGEKKKGGKET